METGSPLTCLVNLMKLASSRKIGICGVISAYLGLIVRCVAKMIVLVQCLIFKLFYALMRISLLTWQNGCINIYAVDI